MLATACRICNRPWRCASSTCSAFSSRPHPHLRPPPLPRPPSSSSPVLLRARDQIPDRAEHGQEVPPQVITLPRRRRTWANPLPMPSCPTCATASRIWRAGPPTDKPFCRSGCRSHRPSRRQHDPGASSRDGEFQHLTFDFQVGHLIERFFRGADLIPATAARSPLFQARTGASCTATNARCNEGWDRPASKPSPVAPLSIADLRISRTMTSQSRLRAAPAALALSRVTQPSE